MFFLNFVRLFFFYSGNSSTYFKVLRRSLQKNLIVRDVLEYNINWNSKSAEQAKAFWFSEGRTND